MEMLFKFQNHIKNKVSMNEGLKIFTVIVNGVKDVSNVLQGQDGVVKWDDERRRIFPASLLLQN